MSEDLPAPLGPTRATERPARASRSAPSTASVVRDALAEPPAAVLDPDAGGRRDEPALRHPPRRSVGRGVEDQREGLRIRDARDPDALRRKRFPVLGQDRGEARRRR